MRKTITCTCCPRSCIVEVEVEGKEIRSIKGGCPRGREYARTAALEKKFILTTSLKINGCPFLLPVKTSRPVSVASAKRIIEKLKRVTLKSEGISAGVVVVKNVEDGVDLIATSSLCEKSKF